MTLWIDDELYVLESQDAWFFNSPYTGVQKNKFKDWLQYAQQASYEVVWVPLKEEYRNRLDIDIAIETFNQLEGTPYGYRNLLFSAIDTLEDNYPLPLTAAFTPILMKYAETFSETTFKTLLLEGLNKRLEFEEPSIQTPQTFEEFYMRMLIEKNMTL